MMLKASQTEGVSNQVSSNLGHKSKSKMFKFQYQNGKKRKSGKNFSGLQNGAIRRLQFGAGFRDCKSGQEGLQKRAAVDISNWGKKVTNLGRDFKSGQEGFQIGPRIGNQCRPIFPSQDPLVKLLPVIRKYHTYWN